MGNWLPIFIISCAIGIAFFPKSFGRSIAQVVKGYREAMEEEI